MKRINDRKKRAEIYQKQKTFIFIEETVPSGRTNFYNGFILEVHEDMIVFFDIVLKTNFPILLDGVKVMEPSKKDMTAQEALKIYEDNKEMSSMWKKNK